MPAALCRGRLGGVQRSGGFHLAGLRFGFPLDAEEQAQELQVAVELEARCSPGWQKQRHGQFGSVATRGAAR